MESTNSIFIRTVTALVVLARAGECNMYQQLTSYSDPYRPYSAPYQSPYPSPYAPQYAAPSPFIHSFASAVPGSSMNTISRGPLDTVMPSHQPPPSHRNQQGYRQAPKPSESQNSIHGEGVNQKTMEASVPASKAPMSSVVGQGHNGYANGGRVPLSTHHVPASIAPMPSLVNHRPNGYIGSIGATGNGGGGTLSTPQQSKIPTSKPVPMTRTMKNMANRWATQLGYKSYYEAHGCVDPTTILLGQHARTASFAMMLGCKTREAQQSCQMAQLSQAGGQAARTRLMMEMMLPKQTKMMFEYCLSPTTLMTGMTGLMTSMASPTRGGLVPPSGAATSSAGPTPDCSMVSQMMMMSPSAAEGMMSPESMEQIGLMRNKYLSMTCQENLILGSMPYRVCCPGTVRSPSLQEVFMMRGMGGA